MANEQNLVPFSQRTESEQREIRSKGGVISGERRRERKEGRELGLYLLRSAVRNKDEQQFVEEYAGKDIAVTQEVSILVNMIQMAKSNPAAFEKLMKYLGLFIEKTENKNTNEDKVAFQNIEELEAYLARLNE